MLQNSFLSNVEMAKASVAPSCLTCRWMDPTDLLTLAVKVYKGVAGRGDVLRRRALVHAVDVEVETTVGVHQQTQHRPLRTRVQVRTVVLTDLGHQRGKLYHVVEGNVMHPHPDKTGVLTEPFYCKMSWMTENLHRRTTLKDNSSSEKKALR